MPHCKCDSIKNKNVHRFAYMKNAKKMKVNMCEVLAIKIESFCTDKNVSYVK